MAMSRKARPTSEDQVAALPRNMVAYESMRDELERTSMGKWVVICECELAGTYDTEQKALEDAGIRFGWGPYHVRQVGPEPVYTLPEWRKGRPLRTPWDHADR